MGGAGESNIVVCYSHVYINVVVLNTSAGLGIKLAVACAPVKRVNKNKEYNASDYEVCCS